MGENSLCSGFIRYGAFSQNSRYEIEYDNVNRSAVV